MRVQHRGIGLYKERVGPLSVTMVYDLVLALMCACHMDAAAALLSGAQAGSSHDAASSQCRALHLPTRSHVAGAEHVFPHVLSAAAAAALQVSKLGPDPLRPSDDAERFWARVSSSRKPVGQLLMDQSAVAGAAYSCI
jgi:formamidopyrimidine-DNA glycosylase